MQQIEDLPALPDTDDVKDTLDDDQLRLFEEMHAAADLVEYDDGNDDVEKIRQRDTATPRDAKE